MIRILSIMLLILLAGCSTPSGRYSISDDVGPDTPITLDHIEDAQPKYEPYSLGGNRDYTLRGNRYQINKNPDGFKQSGKASWYGKKFHGHLTSNGEIYDMYSMTAAHKTLPIPSYVKVTNKDNGKTTIVRINDRGPFYQGRIIDLSYAAAYKLDVIQSGTANVDIEYINTHKQKSEENSAQLNINYVIQAASSNHEQRTRTLAKDLGQKLSVESFVEAINKNYRVLLGPFDDYSTAEQVLKTIQTEGYPQAFIRKTKR
ncbi:endolytic peptidoglycan transglycosylase RlpA [Vibrio sp. MACH09]|uniref:septal ring lytic transglycosylase RlpA family protein n=1 Tax=unclassified Vibrio TaxID=2614977 RepID=UPI001493DA75|nr:MULTISPECIES: septal ring lytic transglycosylase RlpA family protein [unclassified Vibrio]NOI64943.1 septal ring lytic transglycosylase RlpA family protein [Vibrio sp. 99-8-1]GLO61625.1 endolytic peptidoglycan transglycosylase RlpA [Vibrio sp. MACH09]